MGKIQEALLTLPKLLPTDHRSCLNQMLPAVGRALATCFVVICYLDTGLFRLLLHFCCQDIGQARLPNTVFLNGFSNDQSGPCAHPPTVPSQQRVHAMYEEWHLARPTVVPHNFHILLFGMFANLAFHDLGTSRANYSRP